MMNVYMQARVDEREDGVNTSQSADVNIERTRQKVGCGEDGDRVDMRVRV